MFAARRDSASRFKHSRTPRRCPQPWSLNACDARRCHSEWQDIREGVILFRTSRQSSPKTARRRTARVARSWAGMRVPLHEPHGAALSPLRSVVSTRAFQRASEPRARMSRARLSRPSSPPRFLCSAYISNDPPRFAGARFSGIDMVSDAWPYSLDGWRIAQGPRWAPLVLSTHVEM